MQHVRQSSNDRPDRGLDTVVAERFNATRNGVYETLIRPGGKIHNPRQCVSLIDNRLGPLARPARIAVWMDRDHRVIAMDVVSWGQDPAAGIDGEGIAHCGHRHQAAVLLVVTYREADMGASFTEEEQETARMKLAMANAGIKMIDHLVHGGGQLFSFAQYYARASGKPN